MNSPNSFTHEDVMALARELASFTNSVTPSRAMPEKDATGGTVCSLTEAVMGVTAGLVAIAQSIDMLADAVKCDE